MKIILVFSIFLFSTFSVVGQHDRHVKIITSEAPLMLINDSVIGSFQLLKSISKDKILELNIAESKSLGSKKLFLEKDDKKLLTAQISKEFVRKTQKELNNFFGLEASNDIYVNGYLLENKSLLISVESMKKIEVIPADDLFLKKDVLNISI